jgi:hypothetical protein
MRLLLEDIKSLLINRCPVVHVDFGIFLKGLDDNYSSNLSGTSAIRKLARNCGISDLPLLLVSLGNH